MVLSLQSKNTDFWEHFKLTKHICLKIVYMFFPPPSNKRKKRKKKQFLYTLPLVNFYLLPSSRNLNIKSDMFWFQNSIRSFSLCP